MCDIFGSRGATQAAIVPSTNNQEASEQADLEARLRKRRAGAAANVLTTPVGLPVTSRLGQVAQ